MKEAENLKYGDVDDNVWKPKMIEAGKLYTKALNNLNIVSAERQKMGLKSNLKADDDLAVRITKKVEGIRKHHGVMEVPAPPDVINRYGFSNW